MNIAITKGIKITVTTQFRPDLTHIDNRLFFFNYTIKIENDSAHRVQLISRHWKIMDSLAPTRIIEGDGVVGEKPILETGEKFSYTSGCDLSSELGYMEGYYFFAVINDDGSTASHFKVQVPQFKLEYQNKLN